MLTIIESTVEQSRSPVWARWLWKSTLGFCVSHHATSTSWKSSHPYSVRLPRFILVRDVFTLSIDPLVAPIPASDNAPSPAAASLQSELGFFNGQGTRANLDARAEEIYGQKYSSVTWVMVLTWGGAFYCWVSLYNVPFRKVRHSCRCTVYRWHGPIERM